MLPIYLLSKDIRGFEKRKDIEDAPENVNFKDFKQNEFIWNLQGDSLKI